MVVKTMPLPGPSSALFCPLDQQRPKRQAGGDMPLRGGGALAPTPRRGVWLAIGLNDDADVRVRLPDGAIQGIALEGRLRPFAKRERKHRD